MLFDWFTIVAQAINFLILVWLLRRFLYKPVLAAIDAREKKVAAKIEAAAARETQAQVETEALRKRNEVFDHERQGLLLKATDEATAERQRLIESARQDSQVLRVKLTQALANERAELGRQLSMQTQAEVFAVARKTLADLSGVSLEERMIDVFITRLRALPVAVNHTAPARVALVRSAFECPPEGRTKVESAIREHLGADVAIRFETSPELVCGIELTVDGVKLAWSVADYLSSLAQDVTALAATEPTVAAPPTTPVAKETADAH